MEDVRLLVQEEGREARNLVAFHVAVDTPAPRPPRPSPRAPRRLVPRPARLRSASAGRDKRSELRARYWALLFGDLQRAIGEIYNTVEAHENQSECQEVILVLENYTRDFKALGEWFKVKWEYDNTPPPQRPQSLAWEIRKTDFVRPESKKAYSVRSSPSVSGKNSPSLSGHNTPSGKNSPVPGKISPGSGKVSPGSGKISPRFSVSSPKGNVEFFSTKLVSKNAMKPDAKLGKDRLFDIKEKDVVTIEDKVDNGDENVKQGVKDEALDEAKAKQGTHVPKQDKCELRDKTDMKQEKAGLKVDKSKLKQDKNEQKQVKTDARQDKTDQKQDKELKHDKTDQKVSVVEIGKARECPNVFPSKVILKSKNSKLSREMSKKPTQELSSQAKSTADKLDAMENEYLAKKLTENSTKNDNILNQDIELEKLSKEEPKEEPKWDVLNVTVAKTTKGVDEKELGNDIESANDKTDVPTDNINSIEPKCVKSDSPTKSEDNFADVSNESSPKALEKQVVIGDLKTSSDGTKNSIPVIKEPKSLIVSKESGKVNDEIDTQETNKLESGKVIPNLDIKLDENSDIIENKKEKMSEKNKKDKTSKEPPETTAKIKESKPSEAKDKTTEEKPKTDSKLEKDETKHEEQKKSETSSKTEVKPADSKPRPAYSTAAAKPKQVSNLTTKPEMKTVKTAFMTRSKTIVEINTQPKVRSYQRKVQNQNKCSYPFNLTTGRTVFDTNTKVAKKPLTKPQLGSGDNLNKNPKFDVKKLPRPTTLKVNEKDNKDFEKVKDDGFSSSETLVTEMDMNRIESSESLKTLVPDDFDSNSVEVLNVDNKDNDGWLTVKSRKLSRESKKQLKSHWSNRFNQPSATTSLPTLNMISSPKQENNPIVKSCREFDRAKSEQIEKFDRNTEVFDKNTKEHSDKIQSNQQHSEKHDKNPQVFHSQELDINTEQNEKFETEKPTEKAKTMPERTKTLETPPKQDKNRHESSEKRPVKAMKTVKVTKEKSKDTAIIRQKSDVTGLKTRSARSRANKKERKDVIKTDGELTKNRLHSSLESLTTGLARSQESTEDSFDFDKWKLEFKSTFKYLDEDDQIPNHNEILKTADPNEMSEIQEMTSQIEENEKRISWALDLQSEVDTRKLCEEEDLLNRQIMELQQVSDMEMDTETDDTETDAEILIEEPLPSPCPTEGMNLGHLAASLEDQYEKALAGMSWAERVDTLVVLEALVARDPGRAQQLHAKLSQGISRRGSLQDALRRLQAKQARAERQRQEYRTERAKRIHQLLSRVEEVKIAKNQLIEEKRLRMERRLQKAAENRDQHIKDIVRKAHDEEEKLREIAFIKQLEYENKRHEFLEQCRTHTSRLRVMRRQRLNKLEQKAAREAAVGARRQAIEAARKLHVETLLEKRKERDARVEELKEQKKQERDDAAREKAEGVKSRLSALAAAAELETVALRSRIRDKQDASQQRLESHLQAIREKATCPRQATTSESHDQEKELQEETERLEQERRDKEKLKTVKKRARKVKQKLLATSNESSVIDENTLLETQPSTNKLYKVIHQLSSLLAPLHDHEDKTTKKCDIDDVERNNKKNKDKNDKANDIAEIENGDINCEVQKELINGLIDKDFDKSNVKQDVEMIKDKQDTLKPKDVVKMTKKEMQKRKKEMSTIDQEKDGVTKLDTQNEDKKGKKDINNKKKNNKEKKSKEQSSEIKDGNMKETEIVIINKEDISSKAEQNTKNLLIIGKDLKEIDLIVDTDIKNDLKISKNEKDTKINKKNDLIINENLTKNTEISPINIIDVKNENNKKRNKKNRNNSFSKDQEGQKLSHDGQKLSLDRQKLSKTSSICSSTSDMSKASFKYDRKSKTVIDIPLLERSLNELHRLTEKFDMTSKEKLTSQKILGLKVIAQLLSAVADRDDFGLQISTKSLSTAVSVVSKLTASCQMSVSYYLNSSMCVHTVRILAWQLEKDLQDPKEVDLAKQLCDCLSIALDSILYAMRVKERGDAKEDCSLAAMRNRAHTLISYICLTGCVTKESSSEVADSIHTLLTICAELCQPYDEDIGSERSSALQSLRCALGPTLCGSRSELCMLYAPQDTRRALFSRTSSTVRMLRTVAELDHHLVQESFSVGGWPLEFRAAVARMLTQHAPNDRDLPNSNGGDKVDQQLELELVLDLIVLIGFVVVNNTQLQETICDGWSVVKTLCTLPANWLVSKPHCHALLPTLVALSERPSAYAAIEAELSMEMLQEYMKSDEAQKVKLVQVINQGKTKKSSCKK